MPDTSNPANIFAPDGAPYVQRPHRYQRKRTIVVEMKDTGSRIRINERDFDKEKHRKVKEKRVPLKEQTNQEPASQPKVDDSELRARLAAMPFARLQACPDLQRITNRHELTTKDELVDALVSLGVTEVPELRK